jgi:hypothetical protein
MSTKEDLRKELQSLPKRVLEEILFQSCIKNTSPTNFIVETVNKKHFADSLDSFEGLDDITEFLVKQINTLADAQKDYIFSEDV